MRSNVVTCTCGSCLDYLSEIARSYPGYLSGLEPVPVGDIYRVVREVRGSATLSLGCIES